MQTFNNFIDGTWVPSRSGGEFENFRRAFRDFGCRHDVFLGDCDSEKRLGGTMVDQARALRQLGLTGLACRAVPRYCASAGANSGSITASVPDHTNGIPG